MCRHRWTNLLTLGLRSTGSQKEYQKNKSLNETKHYKRSIGRPHTLWTDYTERVANYWVQDAQDRRRWKAMIEAYVQIMMCYGLSNKKTN